MNPSLDRRELLRNGGLVLSMGAVIAACGSNRGGVDAPGRLGVADEDPESIDTTVNDVVLLRTAQSLEYTALDLYAAAGDLGVLDGGAATLAERFVEDHTGHAARIGALITDLGGEEFTCANPFLVDRAVGPVLGAIAESDDQLRDVLNVAYAFEELAGRSYQALVSAISGDNQGARAEAMRIGGDEQRHAAALARAINPDATINPTLVGGEVMDADADGFPIPYAIPAVFGQLTGVPVVLGAPNDEGGRFSATLQTPAENSFVYEALSC
jgi:hypothetical protein